MPVPNLSASAVFVRFLRFGLLAWGGPIPQIAMLRRELVDEEHWIEPKRFNRVLAVYQALPGPEAHELCVYFGQLARGRLGGVLAGLGFMLPGFVLMLLLSWGYVELGVRIDAFEGAFVGLQAAVLALILRGAYSIGRHALTAPVLWALAILGLVAELSDVHFALTLGAAGLVGMLGARGSWWVAALVIGGAVALALFVPALRSDPTFAASPGTLVQGEADLGRLLVTGMAAGLLTFGGAYTSIPIVRRFAVGNGGWMTDGQFLDGLGLGGILPAPLIIFTTFVGYLGAGATGAMVVTAAVFLPAFSFTLIGFRRLEALVEDRRLHSFFDGITAGVVGVIAGTTAKLAPGAVPDARAGVIATAALVALIAWRRSRFGALFVLAGAAVTGHLWW